ncbi:MAG: Ltp family lipoprotein [Coriobacteriia bacterium]|nr:Ltp family lipoprotein [Coriobacteriia bacterium]
MSEEVAARFCTVCGNNVEGAQFCTQCGTALEASRSEQVETAFPQEGQPVFAAQVTDVAQQEKKPFYKLWWVWVLGIFGFLVFCCLAAVVLAAMADTDETGSRAVIVEESVVEDTSSEPGLDEALNPYDELALQIAEDHIGESAADLRAALNEELNRTAILVEEGTDLELIFADSGREGTLTVAEADLANWIVTEVIGLSDMAGAVRVYVEREEVPEVTMSQQQAVRSAENYLNFMNFSRSGLIRQLEFEDFSTEDATFAVDSLSVDWNEQAAGSAENYLDFMSFSRDGLIRQLEHEGFTTEQAIYGVSSAGL